MTMRMTIGHQREYVETDLGHFGMGLKAASFGHSDVLTVWSSRTGSAPVGRRIRRADFSRDFSCEVLSAGAAATAGEQRARSLGTSTGTSVVWTHVRNAYRGASPDEARTGSRPPNSRAVTSRRCVPPPARRRTPARRGARRRAVDAAEGVGIPVTPIDPFGYARSGHPGYPKDLVAQAGGQRCASHCHVWPPKSDVTGFRIAGKAGEQFQGFYIYRNDRLLQAGGWSDTANPSPARQLARVVLDDASAIGSFVTMNPEKHGLKFEPSLP